MLNEKEVGDECEKIMLEGAKIARGGCEALDVMGVGMLDLPGIVSVLVKRVVLLEEVVRGLEKKKEKECKCKSGPSQRIHLRKRY